MTQIKIVYSLSADGITLAVHPSHRALERLPRVFVGFDTPRPDHDHLLEFMRNRWPAIVTLLTGLSSSYEAEIVDTDNHLLLRHTAA